MLTQNLVRELFEEVHMILQNSKIEEARQNTEWILSEILNFKGRAEVYLNRDQEVSEEKKFEILSLVQKRSQGIPLQYLFKNTEFYSLKIRVAPQCLIPRPETEILVEHALRFLTSEKHKGNTAKHNENSAASLQSMNERSSKSKSESPLKVLDIGTGSGNIAIAIAKNLRNCKVLAIDISEEALKLARENVEVHGCMSQIKLETCDITQGLDQEEYFDLIVSNPPYIDEEDWFNLPDEVRLHEPKIALNGGEKGMEIISKVIENASRFLRSGGALMIEISGSKQTPAVIKTLNEIDCFEEIDVLKDYRLEDRIVKMVRR